MELRYLGFDQASGTRVYRFECIVAGQPAMRHTVTVEMRLFLEHRVGIQDGPSLCARKLAAGLESGPGCEHELNETDMLAFAGERAAAEARRAEARRPGHKPRRPEPTPCSSPWRR